MPEKNTALRRRVAPSAPLEISFSDENGSFTQTYRVAFDLNVFAEISEKTGVPALSLDLWTKLDARVLRAMLWAALLPNHPEFDTRDRKGRTNEGIETIGSWLDGDNQERSAHALWEAYLLYLPDDQAEELRMRREKAETGTPAASPEKSGEVPLVSSNSGPLLDMTSESPNAKSAS
jgi:hypothetical protein